MQAAKTVSRPNVRSAATKAEALRGLQGVDARGRALSEHSNELGVLLGKVEQPGGLAALSKFVSATEAGKVLGFAEKPSPNDMSKLVRLARALAPTPEEGAAILGLREAARGLAFVLSSVELGAASHAQKLSFLAQFKALVEGERVQSKGGGIPVVTDEARNALARVLTAATKQFNSFRADFGQLVTGRMPIAEFFPDSDPGAPAVLRRFGYSSIPDVVSDWAHKCYAHVDRKRHPELADSYRTAGDAIRAVEDALRAGDLDAVATAITQIPKWGVPDEAVAVIAWLREAVGVMRWLPPAH